MKLPLVLPPELAHALTEYRDIYNERYSADEPLSELAIHMLATFLAGDRGFKKARAERRRVQK
jgi:hypothetical protein